MLETYIEDGKKLVHLLSLGGVRMKRSLELTALSVATVVLQGFANIVHVESTVTGPTAAVALRVSVEMVITVATRCSGLWLVARRCTPKENNEVDTQCSWQQGTLCSNGDSWMLATCRLVEILRWDRGDDRRAEMLECYGGVTLWQAAKWARWTTPTCVTNMW